MPCSKFSNKLIYFVLVVFSLNLIQSIKKPYVGAFSISWVFEDLLAHPRYKVLIGSRFVADSSLDSFFPEPRVPEKETSSVVPSIPHYIKSEEREIDINPSYVVMRTSSGQRYLCQIPPIANNPSAEENKPETKKPGDLEVLKKGLELLEPMKKENCIYFHQGWWTYEYCHLKHIRQFHQIIEKGIVPVEDPNSRSYYLGKYDPKQASLPHSNAVGKKGKKRSPPLSTDLQAVDEKKILVLRWSDGTNCDLTGKPRRVEIQFHCNTQPRDTIALIKETNTCQYLVMIHTPRLCADPAFLSKTSGKVNDIECNPVVSDAFYEIKLEESQKRLESGGNNPQKTENLKPEAEEQATSSDSSTGETKGDKSSGSSDNQAKETSDLPKEEGSSKAKSPVKVGDLTDEDVTSAAKKVLDRWREQIRVLGNKAGLQLKDIEIEFEDDDKVADGIKRGMGKFKKIKVFFYDENGQVTPVKDAEELLRKIQKLSSTDAKGAEGEQTQTGSVGTDFQTMLEKLIVDEAGKIGTITTVKRKKVEFKPSDQERLSKMYETVYERDENGEQTEDEQENRKAKL
ncbi:hypothetical protein G9A89_003202 [Geosiphon pyriformis]|nr:hypothetical protein G9A89_009072 [Geosiphon pyriformis]KAG9301567.1 hypothetical protein G9A89_003202 [Geosiphon pyriformis]